MTLYPFGKASEEIFRRKGINTSKYLILKTRLIVIEYQLANLDVNQKSDNQKSKVFVTCLPE